MAWMFAAVAFIIALILALVTARQSREIATLRRTKELTDDLLDDLQTSGKIGYWQINFATDKVTWSREMFRLNARDPATGTPSIPNWLQLIHPSDAQSLRRVLERAKDDGVPFTVDVRILTVSGMSVWTRFSGKMRRRTAGGDAVLAGTMMDISSHKVAIDMLHDYRMLFGASIVQPAGTDSDMTASLESFTGVSHHRILVEVLEKEISRAVRYDVPLTMVLVALSEEQASENDQRQHMLRQLAGLLQLQARASDTVARYGSHGFAVILTSTDAAGAKVAVNRVTQAIGASEAPLKNAVVTTGLAQFEKGATATDLIALANKAIGGPAVEGTP
jgi:diguanylate cyclase (GGDEF)-like protein